MAGITKASNELGELAGEAMSLGAIRGAGWMALLLTTCFIGGRLRTHHCRYLRTALIQAGVMISRLGT